MAYPPPAGEVKSTISMGDLAPNHVPLTVKNVKPTGRPLKLYNTFIRSRPIKGNDYVFMITHNHFTMIYMLWFNNQ